MSGAAATASVRSVKRRTGRSEARDTSPPSAAASAIPPAVITESRMSRPFITLSTSLRGRATWMAPPSGSGVVITRRCCPFTARSPPAR